MSKSKSKKVGELTPLQLRFCEEYLIDLNATRAYLRAGYKSNNDNAAAVSAARLLRNDKIQSYLGELANLSKPKIISEIINIALARFTDVAEWNGNGNLNIKPSSEWCDRAKAAVKSITVTEFITPQGTRRTTNITLHGKEGCLDKLMRKFNLYPSNIELLDAVQLLVVEGVATEKQTEIIRNNILKLRDELKMEASNNAPVDFGKKGIS